MAGVDGAAAAVEQMKLQQQEKSKEELVRRSLCSQSRAMAPHAGPLYLPTA